MADEKPQRIRRSPHTAETEYFLCRRDTAQDRTISFEARGMLAYLLSKPADWIVQPKDLQQKDCGRDKVYRILKELEEHHYLAREFIREKGVVKGIEYIVHEEPFPENPDTVEPYTANTDITKYREVPQSKEKDSCSPVGETGVKTEKEAVAPRERNLLFDAVAVHVFGITDLALINGDGAQIGIITAWLDGKLERIKQGRTTKIIGKLPRAASPEHVEMFARAYAKEHKGAALPRDVEKFSNHWRAWASKASRPALRPAARFEDTPPADPEEYMR